MLLSTFIAGLYGNPGQQIRFQMAATLDQALHIPIRVFEAETQEKRRLAFFSHSETHWKGIGNFGQPWKTFGRSEYGQAARISTDTPRSTVSKMPALSTLAAKGNCLVFSVGNRETGTLFQRLLFKENPPFIKNEEKNQYSKSQETGKSSSTMLNLLVKTPIFRKTC